MVLCDPLSLALSRKLYHALKQPLAKSRGKSLHLTCVRLLMPKSALLRLSDRCGDGSKSDFLNAKFKVAYKYVRQSGTQPPDF